MYLPFKLVSSSRFLQYSQEGLLPPLRTRYIMHYVPLGLKLPQALIESWAGCYAERPYSSLTTIFNASLHLGRVPSAWKNSNVTPIFKSGDAGLALNNRPISLLSLVSKIWSVKFMMLYNSICLSMTFCRTCNLDFDQVLPLRKPSWPRPKTGIGL